MKLSIITINYNDAEGLERTMASVVNQTYTDYEYIVIDGGSKDGSVDVIKKYASQISYWVSESDSGIYNAMNKGIKQAKGEYFHFLNSGDCYVDNEVINKVFYDTEYSEPILRGNLIADYGTHRKQVVKFGEKEITLLDLYTHTLSHQSVFLHRSLFEIYGLYDENLKIVSDWVLEFKAILDDTPTRYININIVCFDMYGISNNPNWEGLMYEERRQILAQTLPQSIRTDYDNYLKLKEEVNHSQHFFITNFILSNKVPYFCFKVLNKIYKFFKL